MYVICTEGYPGILNENEVYSVRKVTNKGDYKLYGVEPPYPFTCFDKKRFTIINLDEISIESILSDLYEL